MFELFKYQFFINSLIAAVFTSLSCGIIGTYVVSKRIVFISGGISHASFGGIGLGYFLGINPIIGAAGFAVISSLGIEFISKKSDLRKDSIIGILWAFGMAVGIFFIFITPGYSPNLMSYLFGNILSVSNFDIYLMALLNMAIILFFILLYKEILFIAFDEEYAISQRLPVKFVNYILLCLIALTIVVNIRIVGIILVISLLTIPQAIAGLFSKNFKNIIFLSIVFALLSSISGLFISYQLNIPSGASIIFSSIILFIILKIIKTLYIRIKFKKEIGNGRIFTEK